MVREAKESQRITVAELQEGKKKIALTKSPKPSYQQII